MKKFYFLVFVMLFCTHNYGQLYGDNDDFDGDGIVNINDLDDDNDGIPDDVETVCEAYVYNIGSSYLNNITDPLDIVGKPDNKAARFNSTNSTMMVNMNRDMPAGSVLRFKMYKTGLGINKRLRVRPAPGGDLNNLGGSTELVVSNDQYFTNENSFTTYTMTESARYLYLERVGIAGFSIYIDAIIQERGNNCDVGELTDADIDGIADKFDLDSDNDGCPDSLEGGGTQVLLSQLHLTDATSGPEKAGMIKTAVDSNNGIPLIVGAGNDIGTSENPFDQADECTYWCSDPNGPDTDGDGRPDACDVDDDNDGILDEDEGLVCTSYGYFFDGTRTYTGGGDINNAEEGGVMILENFIRELDANGDEVVGGTQYDLRVELTEVYDGVKNNPGPNRRVDFNRETPQNSTIPAELVVLFGGSPADNPYIKLKMNFQDQTGAIIGLSDATIRFSDIDSDSEKNYTDVIGVLKDSQLTSSRPIYPSNTTFLEQGGFAYTPLDATVAGINTNYDMYRLKQETGAANGVWWAADNTPTPNPVPDRTVGYKFDQLNTLNVVWGYTTTNANAYTEERERGLSFSRDDVQFCVFSDEDKDGIPNEEDLDSDGDGCPDAVEGSANFLRKFDLITETSIPGGNNGIGYVGTFDAPIYETLQVGTDSSNDYGIPRKLNGVPTPNDLSNSQGAGSSLDSSTNNCICEKAKSYDANNNTGALVGITTISRNSNRNAIVTDYSDGFIALESTRLGLVLTRIENPENVFDSNATSTTTADDAVEGMVVWDPAANSGNGCLKLYDGNTWSCIKKSCDYTIARP